MDDAVDPKQFIDKMHQPVVHKDELRTYMEYEGFEDIRFVDVKKGFDTSYIVIWGYVQGDQAKAEKRAQELIDHFGLHPIDIQYSNTHQYTAVYIHVPMYEIEDDKKDGLGEAIVSAMLEDDDEFAANLPKHKSEVRILPTDNPQEFDVTLITGFDPIYIGTIGARGRHWVPVRTMNNVGRKFRTKLHFIGPTKEECAMAMVEVLRPFWSSQLRQARNSVMDSEEIDPKSFLDHAHDTWEWKPYYPLPANTNDQWHTMVLRDGKVIMSNYLQPGDYIRFKNGKNQSFNIRLDALPSQPGHYVPMNFSIYQNRRDPVDQVWSIHLALPGRGNSRKVGEFKTDSFEDAIQKGKDAVERILMRLGESEDIDTKGFLDRTARYVYIVRESDGMDRWLAKSAWPPQKVKTAVTAVFRHRENALNYASNMNGRVFKVAEDSDIVKAWLSTGQRITESSKAEIEKEAAKAEEPASEEQAEAGNYKKGHVSVQGLEIAIENAKGSTREGVDKDGKPWKVTLPAHYGYIKGTVGKDKDHLDVYIGENPGGLVAFVVNQAKIEGGGFDEHKIMLGFKNKDEALDAYDRAFTGDLGPKLRKSVVSTTVDKLKEWIKSGNTKKPFEAINESENLEMGFDDIKRFLLDMRSGDIEDGTEFSVGFAIGTSDQHWIEDQLREVNFPDFNWDALNAAILKIEQNVLKAMREVGIHTVPEGHDDNSVVGSAHVQYGTHGFEVVKQFIEQGEPFRTGSGTLDRVGPNMTQLAYEGVPQEYARLIEIDISFFDLDAVQDALPESQALVATLLETDFDPKAFAMSVPSDEQAVQLVLDTYNAILTMPYDMDTQSGKTQFYHQITAMVSDMIKKLEQMLGRQALDGTLGLLVASAPKPWNYDHIPNYRMSRKYARELLASFRACSKKIKA